MRSVLIPSDKAFKGSLHYSGKVKISDYVSVFLIVSISLIGTIYILSFVLLEFGEYTYISFFLILVILSLSILSYILFGLKDRKSLLEKSRHLYLYILLSITLGALIFFFCGLYGAQYIREYAFFLALAYILMVYLPITIIGLVLLLSFLTSSYSGAIKPKYIVISVVVMAVCSSIPLIIMEEETNPTYVVRLNVEKVDISDDGETLLILASKPGYSIEGHGELYELLQIWNLSSKMLIHNSSINCSVSASLSPDGQYYVIEKDYGSTSSFKVYRVQDDQKVFEIGDTNGLCWFPDGRRMLVAKYGMIRIYNSSNFFLERSIELPPNLTSSNFNLHSLEKSILISTYHDIWIIDATNQTVSWSKRFDDEIVKISVSPDKGLMQLVTLRNGKYFITLLSLSDGEIIKGNVTFEGMECRYFEKQHMGKTMLVFILSYRIESGRKGLLDAKFDKIFIRNETIRERSYNFFLRKRETDTIIHVYNLSGPERVFRVSMSPSSFDATPDGRIVAIGYFDGNVDIIDMETGETIFNIKTPLYVMKRGVPGFITYLALIALVIIVATRKLRKW